MKDWICKGTYETKYPVDDQNNLIPFQELENLADRAQRRLLEYHAVDTTLRQAENRADFISLTTTVDRTATT